MFAQLTAIDCTLPPLLIKKLASSVSKPRGPCPFLAKRLRFYALVTGR